MAREARFNFTSEDHIKKAAHFGGVEYRVSLVVSHNKKKDGTVQVQHNIYFPKEVIWLQDLKGKRLKFYLDADKKAIAWRVMDGEVTTLDALNRGREVKPWASGSWMTGVSKLLNHAGIKVEEGRSSIPVEKYVTTELGTPMSYWYIKLA